MVNVGLRVWVGPYVQTGLDTVPIDESTLEWDGDTVQLIVVLIPLDARPGHDGRS